jgi:hypothetical protein
MFKKTLKFKSRSKPKSRSRSKPKSRSRSTLKKSIFNSHIKFEKLPQFKTILQKPYSGEKEIKINKINKIKTEKNTDFPFISNLSLLNKTKKPRKYTLKKLFLFNKKKKNNKNKNKIRR